MISFAVNMKVFLGWGVCNHYAYIYIYIYIYIRPEKEELQEMHDSDMIKDSLTIV